MSAFAYAKPGAGGPIPVVGGHLAWGFSQTFQSEARTDQPLITVGGGATEERDGTIDFPSAGGTYDSASGTATMKYRGTVVITYTTGSVSVTNPTVAIDPKGSKLRADLTAPPGRAMAPANPHEQTDLGDILTFGIAPSTAAQTVTWTGLPTTLTATGATAFPAGFEGAPLGPVTFAAQLAVPVKPLAKAPKAAPTSPGPTPATATPSPGTSDCPSPTASATGSPPVTPSPNVTGSSDPTSCPSTLDQTTDSSDGGTTDSSNGTTSGTGDKLAKTGGPFAPLMLLGLILSAIGAGTMTVARRRALS